MNTVALNDNHDMYVKNGQIARYTASEAIMQTVKTRLLTVREEWFMDLSAGLPWYTEMIGKNKNPYKIRAYIAKEIVKTDGVVSLKSLEFEYNKAIRKLDIEFRYTDIYGNEIQGSI